MKGMFRTKWPTPLNGQLYFLFFFLDLEIYLRQRNTRGYKFAQTRAFHLQLLVSVNYNEIK